MQIIDDIRTAAWLRARVAEAEASPDVRAGARPGGNAWLDERSHHQAVAEPGIEYDGGRPLAGAMEIQPVAD
jgi:hypothetical protein